jgi:tetratricopeptide (TPR) repeat protein
MSRAPKNTSAVWEYLKAAVERMDSSATFLRTLAVNIAFLLTFAVVLPLILIELAQGRAIIEPINVPENITALGMTSDVAANRLWDGLADAAQAARTDKRQLAVLPSSQRVQFEFPDSGLSFDSLIHHARRFLGLVDTRIGGEFVCDAAPCTRETMRLRVRIVTTRAVAIDLPPVGSQSDRSYFKSAALAVLGELDPFVAAAAQIESAPDHAMTRLRRLVASGHPDAEWAHNLIGLALMKQNQNNEAKRAFEAALAIDPRHVPALINTAILASQTGDADGAERAASKAAGIAPRDWRTWMARAEAAFAAKDSKRALGYLDQAAAADRSVPWPLVRKGLALDEPAQREAAFRAALERDPDNVEAYVGLAALAGGKQDFAGALAAYQEIVRITPEDHKAHSAAAGLYAIVGQRPEAIATYRRSLSLKPDDTQVMHKLGLLLRDAGDLTGAEAVLRPAAIDIPEALFELGDTLQRKGNAAEARDAFTQFLAKVPDSPYRPIAEAQLKRLAN